MYTQKMTVFRRLLASWFLCLAALSAQAQPQNEVAARNAVSSFYRSHIKQQKLFTARSVRLWRSSITPELYQALLYELKRQANYLRANPGNKPFFEGGDPFIEFSDGYPTAFSIGRIIILGGKAYTKLSLAFTNSTGKWKDYDSLALQRINGRWLVSDRGSNLLKTLRRRKY